MILEQLRVGEHRTNCYIFGDEATKEVAIVDPGYEGDRILGVIKENNYKVKYILLTHGHFDHIGEVKYLKEQTGAEILIHKADSEMLIDPRQNLSAWGNPLGETSQVNADKLVDDGDRFTLGELPFVIIHTPGHTMGCVSILCDKSLFSGDTLFRETVGRTDLPHSSHSDILRSVNKLMKLDDAIEVYPGHGITSTIGYEKENNPFVR